MSTEEIRQQAIAAIDRITLPDLCVVEDLAPFLRCSPATVRRHLREGRLPGVKLGKRWIIHRRTLEDFFETWVVRNLTWHWNPRIVHGPDHERDTPS